MATYTGSVTLTNINDGADADTYRLSSNIEGFQKHYEYDQNGNEVVIFSDNIIEFQLEYNVDGQPQPVSPSEYYTSLLTLKNDRFEFEETLDVNDLWGLFSRINVKDGNDIVTLYDKVYSIDNEKQTINFNLYNSVFYKVDEELNLEYSEWLYNGEDNPPENWNEIYQTLYIKNGDEYEPNIDSTYHKNIIYYVLQPSNYYVVLKTYREFVEQQNAYFILNAFKDQNLTKLYNSKIFFVEYVVSRNFARFALTATNIQASVDNSSMIFDGDGLTIYDGGLTIKQSQQYIPTRDNTRQSGKDYYIYTDNQYKKIAPDASFESGIIYYELLPEIDLLKYESKVNFEPWEPDQVQWSTVYRTLYILEDGEYRQNTDPVYHSEIIYYTRTEDKRLNIKGSGEFTGTIYATDGEFSGTISALAGSIGGFTIENDALKSETRNEITEDEPLKGKKYYIFKDNNYELVDLSKKETQDISRKSLKDYYIKINDEYILYEGEYIQTEDIIRQQNKFYYIKDNENQYIVTEDNYIQTEDQVRQQNKIYYIKNENNDYIPTNDNYFITTDTEKQEEKTYYIRDVDGNYIEYTGSSFVTGETYYEFNTQFDESKTYYEFNTNFDQSITYYEFDTNLHSGTTYYENYFTDGVIYYDDPSVQLLGQQGKIIAKNIDLGTGVNITDYIKLGNAYIYNPSNYNNNFIDIKDIDGNKSIINFRADGIGNIGAIHINGNSSRLNGVNWWISPDKASFSNIDVTGTIHTSVFETGRIQSVGGSMIFKEGAKVQSLENTTEGLILTLETKMSLKPGSIVLCTTNDSDYTDTTLTNQENFYGKVISSVIPREYVENTQPFFENVIYYTKNENDQYTRFTGNSFEDGETYYILVEGDQQVVIELEPNAIGYENLINQIIQLGDNNFSPTEDRSRYSEWEYTTPEEWNNIYNTLYIKSNDDYILLTKKPSDWEENYYKYYIQENNNYKLIGSNEGRIDYGVVDQAVILVNSTAPNFALNTYYAKTSTFIKNEDSNYDSQETYYINNNKDYYTYETLTDSLLLYTGNDLVQGTIYFERESTYINNLIIGVNASEHINKMLYPEGFTFVKFDGLVDNINPTYDNTPILFLGNLDGLNDENISGYGLYGENVFLTGSLTTRYASTENFKYAGVNTLTGAIATIFEEGNYFPGELLPENDKIIFWAGSESTAAEDIQTSPLQITEHGYFYASHGVFEGSIFVKATIEASELRTASIYGTGSAPALKIYDTNLNREGIHFYNFIDSENEEETLRLTSSGFSNNQGTSYFISINNSLVDFNGNNITGNVFYTIPVENSYLEIIGTNLNVYQNNQEGLTTTYNFINFNSNKQFYEIKYDDDNRILQDKQNGELVLFSGSTKISNNLSLGGKIDYRPVTEDIEGSSELIGYDLYVR